ncbi:hypothetical protein [Saccharothrix coeruleofusca]|uniref:Transporter n=1 Tax=Saccharothrix coeruleofusca TaxID=33919 RepID=A0A918AQF5_9PSEU|nr:hypothetical protein [Saccharothrix coeruleofusca]GGP70209.1 transporter [Saccharothrix coeruleofusca]
MTITTTTTTETPVRVRAAVGWGDLLWLTWRQHRWVIGGTALVVAGTAAVMALVRWMALTGRIEQPLPLVVVTNGMQLVAMSAVVPWLLGMLFAAFWGAPLLAREYEQRTHLVAWSQDLTAARWLVGKLVLLGAAAAGLAAALGAVTGWMITGVNSAVDPDEGFGRSSPLVFDTAPALQVVYALFGFALGVALSALIRRTMPAVALASIGFLVVRVLVGGVWRLYYQAPLRHIQPISGSSSSYWAEVNRDAMYVQSGHLDAAGNVVEYPTDCVVRFDTEEEYDRCLTDRGIVEYFTDYQPAERMTTFQFIECLIFLVMVVGLLVLAYFRVRRSQRV